MASRQLMAGERAGEIAELGEAVADEHCPALHVDPEQIARAKRITVSFGDYGETTFDGLLEYKAGPPARRTLGEGRFHIFCNVERVGQRGSPRARFTLAHELGHYYIDEHRLALSRGRVGPHSSKCEYESPILAEQEADLFAANLLLPRARFIERARRSPPGLEGILKLAERFKTSITATAIRYAQTDIAPCAVIKWNWKGYAWKHVSDSAFRAYLRRTYEAARDLPPDCPTRKALARQTPGECGYFEAGTTASAWFPRIKAGEWRDAIFIEQAIPLGRFGVLTFLYPQRGA